MTGQSLHVAQDDVRSRTLLSPEKEHAAAFATCSEWIQNRRCKTRHGDTSKAGHDGMFRGLPTDGACT